MSERSKSGNAVCVQGSWAQRTTPKTNSGLSENLQQLTKKVRPAAVIAKYDTIHSLFHFILRPVPVQSTGMCYSMVLLTMVAVMFASSVAPLGPYSQRWRPIHFNKVTDLAHVPNTFFFLPSELTGQCTIVSLSITSCNSRDLLLISTILDIVT